MLLPLIPQNRSQNTVIGRTLAHYEITAQVGKGGMGEVYRARDTKLERDVALKVLPQELSGDPERKARFQREARSLASLQHPNVASIYGFEDVDGVRFLVMELVEGEDLARRIERGAIPADEVLGMARQIAAGLEAAHESSLVHRDLKPANIMLTPEGEIKILDFGLARAWYGDVTDDQDLALSPTITAAMTQAGTILGTAAYMSPEQARGRNLDRRTDIWAFGVILWEMVTGQQLFQGETVSDTMAAVLRAEPDWSLLPTDDAPQLCHLIERCLQRDPRQRLRDIGEARILLQPGGASSSGLLLNASMMGMPAAEPAQSRSLWPALLVVALICLGVGATVGMFVLGGGTEAPLLHAMIPPPPGTDFELGSGSPGPAAISPDGTMVVFAATDEESNTLLYLRHLDRGQATILSGTDDGAYPFWSPDSEFVGFVDGIGRKLRKISVRGGPPTTLCAANNGKGGSWNRDGVIIFAPDFGTTIHRVMDTGGDPVSITEFADGEDSHRHPRFMPDGNRYLYLARTSSGSTHTIYMGTLDGAEPRVVAASEGAAEYSAGHLLTVRERVLMATPFDPGQDTAPVGGTPLVEDLVVLSQGSAIGIYSSNLDGMLVYQTGNSGTERFLSWTDLDNGATSPLGEPGPLHVPRISPDGTRAAVEVRGESGQGADLWIVDLLTGLRTRFTFAEGDESFPAWTPDSSAIVYVQEFEGHYSIIRQPVEGTEVATTLIESEFEVSPSDISPDGATILLNAIPTAGEVDIYALESTPGSEMQPLRATPEAEGGAVYSPDGRWIAFHGTSDQGWDLFVVAANGATRKWQVTNIGAVWPRWNPDGTALLCAGFDGTVYEYDVDGTGDTFRIGNSREVAHGPQPSADGLPFDLHPGGTRILAAGQDPAARGEISLLHLVTDWQKTLAR
jgi:Tol biopolymer transport system component/tRNA A-37 threonylcarbamoyl transferase component Bud32